MRADIRRGEPAPAEAAHLPVQRGALAAGVRGVEPGAAAGGLRGHTPGARAARRRHRRRQRRAARHQHGRPALGTDPRVRLLVCRTA